MLKPFKYSLFVCLIYGLLPLSITGQTVEFSCGSLIKKDSLIIAEHTQDQVYYIKIKSSDLEKNLDIKLTNIATAAAENNKDYEVVFTNNGNYELNSANSYTIQFELRLKADAFKEPETEYFMLNCTYKKFSTGKSETKKLIVGITDMATTPTPTSSLTTTTTPSTKKISPVYNSYIDCNTGKPTDKLELTLSAIEENSQIERMLITWSAVGKENWSDTFLLISNRTNFVTKAKDLAKTKSFECTADSFVIKLEIAYDAAKTKIEKRKTDIKNNTIEGKIEKKIDSALNIFSNAIKNIADEQEDAVIIELQNDWLSLRNDTDECQLNIGVQRDNKILSSTNEPAKKLKIDSVVIKVFNNQIYQIDIVTIEDEKMQTITNPSWGLPLRSLIEDRGDFISVFVKGIKYKLCYCDLFFIRPSINGAINYTLKDGQYVIHPPNKKETAKTKVPISQKKLLDFFSATVFFDFLSIDKNNANKNFFAEAFFRFNVNNNNNGRIMITKELYTTISLATNAFGGSDPGIKTIRDTQYVRLPNGLIDSATANKSYLINYFDLYKNQFFQARPILNILGIDLKSKSTYWEAINAGFHFLGSNATTIDRERGIDSVQTRTIFSVSPVIETRFKVNPKTNFGIDFHFSYLFGFANLASEFKTLSGRENLTYLKRQNEIASSNGAKVFQKKDMLIGELNFFFNPSKPKSNMNHGGFFFRINMAKPVDFSRMGHFMFLGGYSTDINTFMR